MGFKKCPKCGKRRLWSVETYEYDEDLETVRYQYWECYNCGYESPKIRKGE